MPSLAPGSPGHLASFPARDYTESTEALVRLRSRDHDRRTSKTALRSYPSGVLVAYRWRKHHHEPQTERRTLLGSSRTDAKAMPSSGLRTAPLVALAACREYPGSVAFLLPPYTVPDVGGVSLDSPGFSIFARGRGCRGRSYSSCFDHLDGKNYERTPQSSSSLCISGSISCPQPIERDVRHSFFDHRHESFRRQDTDLDVQARQIPPIDYIIISAAIIEGRTGPS